MEREYSARPTKDEDRNDSGFEAAEATGETGDAEFNAEPEAQADSSRFQASNSDTEGNVVEAVEETDEKFDSSRRTRLLDVLHHWAWITIFSILGTLTRLGLQSLNTYAGQHIPSLVWAQFVGCAVIGFLTEDNRIFPKKNKYDALFLGLTVGYCGSTTSFSAWILQVFEDLANTGGFDRSSGYNVISIITQIMTTFAASFFAFRLGNHIAILLDKTTNLSSIAKIESTPQMLVILGVAIFMQAGAIIATGIRRDWRGVVGFAMVFSPAGALTRWYLSRWMNQRIPGFPLGTFSANMIGCMLESIFHLLQFHAPNGTSCSTLQGMQDGYCGALSTVSTFVLELATLKRRHAYKYALISVVCGLIFYVLIDGIDFWTHGSARGYNTHCTYETP